MARLGELSAFMTVIAVIGATITIMDRVGSVEERTLTRIASFEGRINIRLAEIDGRVKENCHSFNSAIILTLEASRPSARERGTEDDLDRVIERFEAINRAC